MSKQLKTKRGFTIIEVALVLAIGGLIMMMVFLALPALQRSQRDRQRQEDMSRLTAAVIEYQSNNRNRVPTTVADWAQFKTDYLGGDDGFTGPNNDYIINTGSCESGGDCTVNASALGTGGTATTQPGDEQIYVFSNANCLGSQSTTTGEGESATTTTSTISNSNPAEAVSPANKTSGGTALARKLAFVIRLEGSSTLYCLNN